MQAAAGIDPVGRSSRFALSTLGSLRSGAMSSRRSSEDSLEDEGRSLRDIRQEIKVRTHTLLRAILSFSIFASLQPNVNVFSIFYLGCRRALQKSNDSKCPTR